MGSYFTQSVLAVALTAFSSSAYAWEPGVGNESDTSGFAVNTQSRNDVVSFWHCVYTQSEGYENRISWTGSIASSSPGTTSAAFKNDIERRINYFRAMAGMSANINLTSSATVELGAPTPAEAMPPPSTTKVDAAQAAAFMSSSNSAEYLSPDGGVATGSDDPHEPPPSWSQDSATARNGAFHSNLAVGSYGPGAIDAYMDEDDQAAAGAENNDVGHRRLILFSRIQEMATGDVTGTSDPFAFSANALYVSGNLLSPPTPHYVAWPNSGYVPAPLLPIRWSLTYPNADFSNASLAVSDNSGSVGTTIVSTTASYGDATIAWKLNSAVPSSDTADQSYTVTVSNIIINGTAHSHTYPVTIINPDRLLESSNLLGSTSPPDTGANYFFETVPHAEAYEIEISSQVTATWFEGAEDGTDANIIDNTDVAYDLREAITYTPPGALTTEKFWDTGSKAFRLAFPRNEFDAFQSFEIDRTLIPQTGAQLSFRFRRGYMVAGTQFEVQSSTNGGTTWNNLETYSGTNNYDSSFTTKNIALTSTGQNTLIRFILHNPSGGVFDLDAYAAFPIGAFIDGIQPINCETLQPQTTASYPASADFVTLDASSAGGPLTAGNTYIMRLRTKVGCKWFAFGDSLKATPVTAASLSTYELWFRSSYAIIGNFDDDYDADGIPNGVEHVLGLNPMDATDTSAALTSTLDGGDLELSHSIISGGTVEAEYSYTLEAGSWNSVTVTNSGGVATASFAVPTGKTECFIRWKAIEP